MLSKTEKKVFIFIGNLPKKFLIGFFIGLFIFLVKYSINYILPLQQKAFIDISIKTKILISKDLYKLIGLYFIASLMLLLEYFSFRKQKISLSKYLYKYCIYKIISLPKQKISLKGIGYYNSIINSLTNSLSNIISPTIFELFFSSIMMVGVNIIIYKWHKTVFYVLCGSYLLVFINIVVFHKLRRKYIDKYNETIMEVSSQNQNFLSNIFTIKIFNSFSFLIKPMFQKFNDSRKHLNSFQKAIEINRFIFSCIQSFTFLIILVLMINSLLKNEFSYGQLIAIINYFSSIFLPFQNYNSFLNNMISFGSWIDKFENAFNDPNIEDFENPEYKKNWVFEKFKSLEFQKIKIPNINHDKSFSFLIQNKIGLVGISGEGKSSILKTLYREIKIKDGKILVNQKFDHYSIPLFYYYNRFNILSQEVEIFNKNLEFNLLLGKKLIEKQKSYEKKLKIKLKLEKISRTTVKSLNRIDEELLPLFFMYNISNNSGNIDQKIFKEFCEKININLDFLTNQIFELNFVEKEEYEKIIQKLNLIKLKGRNFGDNGNFLSGGEKQKIAIARFLLKNDYDFFILDEPFTALDSINEDNLIYHIKDKIRDKNGIIISHSFHILEKLAEKFIVIENGCISEQGTLSELIERNGLFHRLREQYYKNINKNQYKN